MNNQLVAAVMLAAGFASAQTPEAKQLAPTGTLRVTFLGGNPVQGVVDAKTGEVTGPVADITRELARRLGVAFQIKPSMGVRGVLDAITMHTADLGFLAFDATRATEVDFSEPYELAYNTFVVRADSPIQRFADADREGTRIAAPKGDSGDLYLSRTLKHAELKSIPGLGVEQAERMLAASEIEAFATNRERLTEQTARFPNLRLLSDNFFAVEQSLVVSKGDPDRVAYLNRALDDLRASGFLQAAIDRAQLHGVEVAPPANRPR
jgi:polar amino acid transport system substrate-binding protein